MTTRELKTGEIHIWYAWFSDYAPVAFTGLLSSDEHRRAQRFLGDDVREKFIITRGLLRTLLSQYTDIAPENITFTVGKRGKPRLDHPHLRFNLSHSADLWALALINSAEIGVDVEQIRPMQEMHTVARDNFSAQEFATWEALSGSEQQQAFYNIWTRKEAYIKATGDGLHLPLASFTVNHDSPPRFIHMADDNPQRWTLYHPAIAEGYASAICTTLQGANSAIWQVEAT